MKSSATIWMVYKSTSGSCFTGFIDMGSWFRDTCSGGGWGGGAAAWAFFASYWLGLQSLYFDFSFSLSIVLSTAPSGSSCLMSKLDQILLVPASVVDLSLLWSP